MARTVGLLAGITLIVRPAPAQSSPWTVWSKVRATAFNGWTVESLTSVSTPGTYELEIDTANPPVIPGGPVLQPLATDAPLLVDPGPRQEIATPTDVHCSWSPGECSVTVTLQQIHRAPFLIRSGTAGLQEAINFASSHGDTVVVDASWAGTDAMIAAAQGSANARLLVETSDDFGWFDWNGLSYVKVIGTQPAAAASGLPSMTGESLTTQAPAITPTSIEQTQYADLFGASGSSQTATGSISEHGSVLSLAAARDFRNGEGVQVIHAGAPVALPVPAAPEVTAVGAAGTATCSYAIAALDGNGGETGIGVPSTIMHANPALNGTQTYNLISWTPVSGARGYAIYGTCTSQSPLPLLGLTDIPAYYIPFQPSAAYAQGQLIQPSASEFNGWVYRVTVGGTSGAEPAWCATPGCMVTSGGVTLVASSLSWADRGAAIGSDGFYLSPTVAATAPASALSDSLVAAIRGGAGTLDLTLSASAGTAVAGAVVLHDDTAALQAAINAAQTNPYISPGSIWYMASSQRVVIPSGRYNLSGGLTIPAYISIEGANQSTLIQTNPTAPILQFSYSFGGQGAANLNLVGGSNQVVASNPDVDATTFFLRKINSNSSMDYAVLLVGDGNVDLHMSMIATLADLTMTDDRRTIWSGADYVNATGWWVESYGDSLADPDTALGYVYHGSLHLDHSDMIGPGAAAGQRWFDNYDSFYSDGTRWGGEQIGGLPVVYNYAGYGTWPNFSGGIVSITNSPTMATGGGDCGCVIELVSGIPSEIQFAGNQGFITPQVVTAAPEFNVQSYLNAAMTAGAMGHLAVEMAGLDTPPQQTATLVPSALLSLMTNVGYRRFLVAPNAGLWWQGQYAANAASDGTAPDGWLAIRTGQAAAGWAPNEEYSAGTLIEATPDDEHVFMAIVAGMSGATAPAWNVASGGETTDGGVIWKESGASAGFMPVGIRQAAYAGLLITGSPVSPASPNGSLAAGWNGTEATLEALTASGSGYQPLNIAASAITFAQGTVTFGGGAMLSAGQTLTGTGTFDFSHSVSTLLPPTTAFYEGSAPVGQVGQDMIWGDAGTHRLMVNLNNSAPDEVVGANTADTFTNKVFDTGAAGNVLRLNGTAVTGATAGGMSAVLLSSTVVPTIASGFGTGASVLSSNGPAAFRLQVGAGGTATGVISLPSAASGWNCFATDVTTAATNATRQTSGNSTSVTLSNFNNDGSAATWPANDVLAISCFAF